MIDIENYCVCKQRPMEADCDQLLKQIKEYRDGMVARNYPYQQISEQLQDELEPIKDFLEEAEKEKKELNESYQESVRQARERKGYNEHNRDTRFDPFKGTDIEGKD